MALKARGIKFDVISGTSVGALNAAITSAGLIESGKELWRRLSFNKVCEPTRRFTTWLLIPFHLLALFLHHVPFIGSLPFSNRLEPKNGYAFILAVVGVPIAFMWLIILVSIWFVDDRSAIFARCLLYTALLAVLGLLWAVPFWMRQKNRTLFTVAPLRNEITRVLEGAELNVPTYITVAYRKEMFDPDMPGFYSVGGEFYFKRHAMSQEDYLPRYVRLDGLPIDLRIDFLTASAAIPFGIFPSVDLEGIEYIDGGVIDNTPIFPISQYHDCDEVYVIRLRPNRIGDIEKIWQRVDRILRVVEMSIEECKALYYGKKKTIKSMIGDETINPPENVTYREFPIPKDKLIVISPEKSLGSFWRGTMNFTSGYTNKLLRMGLEDTSRILNQGA